MTVSHTNSSHFFPPSPINGENELPNSPTDTNEENKNTESGPHSNKFDFNHDDSRLVVDFHEDCDTTTESLDANQDTRKENQKQSDSSMCDEGEKLEAGSKMTDKPFLASESTYVRNASDLPIINEAASCSDSKNSSKSFSGNVSSIIEEDENSDSMLNNSDSKTSPYSYAPKQTYENVSDYKNTFIKH